MDENTTTEAVTQDDQAPIVLEDEQTTAAQPEEQQATAATPTDSEPTSTNQPEDGAEPAGADNSGDDIAAWLASKGIDPSTPEGQAKLAKSYREAERAMHQSKQSNALEDAVNEAPVDVDTDNELVREALTEVSQLKTSISVEKWKASNGISDEQEAAIAQYVTDNPQKAAAYRAGVLTLDDIYAMSGVGKVDPSALKEEGKKAGLTELANKQRAAAVKGSATSPTPAKPDKDAFLAGFDKEL